MRQGVLLGLLVVASLGLACAAAATDPAAPANKRPWFCRGRDCPDFKTLDEEDGYTRRCYEKSNWAVSCAWDATMPEGILRARANVLAYIKENDLWGATPFASLVHLSFGNQAAWNASFTSAAAAALGGGSASAAALAAAAPALEGCVHRTVCFAYFLPSKYQGGSPARTEVDRRPPRPRRDSHVRIIRAPRFEAFASSGFAGFATPARFVLESVRLANALRWHGQTTFDWTTGILFEYSPPSQPTDRWNEVLIPAKSWHSLLVADEASTASTAEQ